MPGGAAYLRRPYAVYSGDLSDRIWATVAGVRMGRLGPLRYDGRDDRARLLSARVACPYGGARTPRPRVALHRGRAWVPSVPLMGRLGN